MNNTKKKWMDFKIVMTEMKKGQNDPMKDARDWYYDLDDEDDLYTIILVDAWRVGIVDMKIVGKTLSWTLSDEVKA